MFNFVKKMSAGDETNLKLTFKNLDHTTDGDAWSSKANSDLSIKKLSLIVDSGEA